MIKKILLMATVLTGLAISGCTEQSIQTVNDTMDIRTNTTNAAVNISEQAGNATAPVNNDFSFIFNLEEPPEEVIGG
ncbi:MAG: hypothetical protein C5S47_00330 [Candidatus Methanogasteraceae archaeon]|nr:MAG: hypothetical protein C5S47_00330 [ANME-2 cluster archaeon]